MRKKSIWIVINCLVVTVLLLASCARAVNQEEEALPPVKQKTALSEEAPAVVTEETAIPEDEEVTLAPSSALPLDTTPPSTITGLVGMDAYDGKVNLWWDKSTAEDFDHYRVYLSQTEIADVTGMTPVHKAGNITTNMYQVIILEDGTKYYFAVTAVDKTGNENTRVAGVSVTTLVMPEGIPDPDIQVVIYQSDKAWAGTTLLADNHIRERPRIIEVNMLGEIVWEYLLPQNLRQYTNPGFDVEWLPNNNILFVLPGKGVYEIDRNGDIVWLYLDEQVSHDADRLANGNTLVVFGNEDSPSDAQVKEINPEGEIVWAWYAKDHFNKPPYEDIYDQGWTHTNAVTRLPSGNTLISPRNFNFLVEVDSQGSVVRTIGEGILRYQHDPEILPNGNILIANHRRPHRAIEIAPQTGKIIWQSAGFARDVSPVRDANRLPNGNTLITGTTKIVEVTTAGEIVWQLTLQNVSFERKEGPGLGFYKAERIGRQR